MERAIAPSVRTVALLTLLLCVFSIFPNQIQTHAHAQTVAGTDPFTVDTDPEYPAPYQTVTVTPSSTLFDISAATISVSVNGASFYKGSGGQPIQVPVGGPGSTTKIDISAVSAGQTYSKTIEISPADVALVTEPDSSTHPFYQGTGLIGSEGGVRIIAVPDLRTSSGDQLDPSTLEYTWKLGDQVLQSDSGIGKDVLNATAPMRYRDADVSVTVANTDGSLVAQADVPISPADTSVQLYRDDPLLGPNFDTALGNAINMPDTEETYIAVPYYFSETPTFDWQVNSAESGSTNEITVRSSGSGQGSADLHFAATQSDTSQSADISATVVFGQKQSVGIFGL